MLVLGAGASIPFGFPSGYDLLRIVCAQIDKVDPLAEYLMKEGFEFEVIRAFRTALSRSGRLSVDKFLEHRPDFLDVGKAAIAHSLIRFEDEAALFDKSRPGNWYEYLFNALSTAFGDLPKNRLAVLTYNYDRSLEHFLISSVESSYNVSRSEAAKVVATIPIVHLHGQLGALPEYSEEGRPYTNQFTRTQFRNAWTGIQIIHETTDGHPQFERARELLTEAERICFIGFGYDSTNISRIASAFHRGQWIAGSCFAMTEAECRRATRLISLPKDLFQASVQISHNGLDCLAFLRNTPIFD